ncbi:hypothetical protein IWW45_001359 [Coemansia sp. RSA 485]|nr:hypothetical protein IWW45_001359 [Coemansia sp. RSA 485]
MLFKPLVQREHSFYEQAGKHPLLKSFIPEFYGTLQLNKDPSNGTDIQEQPFESLLCLENLVCGFESPCVMDIKIGTRMHDIDATPEKAARMKAKADERTAIKIGFAVSGMSQPGQPTRTMDWAIKLTTETVVTEALVPFFATAESAIGSEYRRFIINQFITEVKEYRDVIRSSETRMYSSSLLLIYDTSKSRYARFLQKNTSDHGKDQVQDENEDEEPENTDALFDMRAIDFAHSHWVPGQGPDEQYLFGLDNLINILQQLLE